MARRRGFVSDAQRKAVFAILRKNKAFIGASLAAGAITSASFFALDRKNRRKIAGTNLGAAGRKAKKQARVAKRKSKSRLLKEGRLIGRRVKEGFIDIHEETKDIANRDLHGGALQMRRGLGNVLVGATLGGLSGGDDF